MSEKLKNLVCGGWSLGTGPGTSLFDPLSGAELVRVSSEGLDLRASFEFARDSGGQALREMTYRQRAAALANCVAVLKANRDRYFDISLANSGTTKPDSSVDIDGAIFTLNYFARVGATLGDGRYLLDGSPIDLSKDGAFKSRHILVPTRGVALCINAFNFPAWGLWEKAAPALLSGVPVIVKPATSTAWLAQQMVSDIVTAEVLPPGALSIVCGSSQGLLDQLSPFDLLSFTGSADTASHLRAHEVVRHRAVRTNIESDSINSALLGPAETADSDSFNLLVREVVREMTVKSGQKCTAIRRVFVPDQCYEAVLEALSSELRKVTVGNPRNPAVQMGSLVNLDQLRTVREGIEQLRREATVVFDGAGVALQDVDPSSAAVTAPYLLACRDGANATAVHGVEVFGPVATVVSYRTVPSAFQMLSAGGGSLVCSTYGSEPTFHVAAAIELAASHGRVHAISPGVATTHTGHGNVVPQSIHGGPGRAGGGEELGGLRSLAFFHRRCAVQADGGSQDLIASAAVSWAY